MFVKEIFLLKLGEIVLKGANKRQFEDKLRQNVRRRMKPYGNFDVYIMQSTVYVEPVDDEKFKPLPLKFSNNFSLIYTSKFKASNNFSTLNSFK